MTKPVAIAVPTATHIEHYAEGHAYVCAHHARDHARPLVTEHTCGRCRAVLDEQAGKLREAAFFAQRSRARTAEN